MSRKNTLDVWKYLKKLPNTPNEAVCLICSTHYKHGHVTSNLHEHLRRVHQSKLYADKRNAELEKDLDMSSSNQPSSSKTLNYVTILSSLLMLERLVTLKEPLTCVMMSLKDGPTMLLPMEWRIIEDIIPLLTPFNLMTTELSGEKYPTLVMVIPLVRGVNIALNSKIMETELGVALKTKLIKNMSDRFNLIEDNDVSPCYTISTVLDPRFKKVAFINIELANKAIQSINNELATSIGENREHSAPIVNHEPQENQCSDLWAFLATEVEEERTTLTSNTTALTLINQYMSSSGKTVKYSTRFLDQTSVTSGLII